METTPRRRVFISGPISNGGRLSADEIGRNLGAFYAAEAFLAQLDYEAVNPLRVHGNQFGPSTTRAIWEQYLRIDIRTLTECDVLYLLPGWKESEGSRLEWIIAETLGMQVIVGELA